MDYPTAYEAAVVALAAGRVSHTLTQDEIFRPAREWIYLRSAPDGDTIRVSGQDMPAQIVHHEHGDVFFDPNEPREPQFFGQLVQCPYCLSFYVSVALFLFYLAAGSVAVWILTPLALWMIATWLAAKVI